jgi:hypothetical protein
MSARCGKCGAPVDEPAHCTNGHTQPLSGASALAAVLGELRDRIAALEMSNRKLCKQITNLAAEMPAVPGQLVDAHAVARLTGMSERWVYDHADELRAIRAGDGERPRLRFDPGLVRATLAQRTEDSPAPRTPTSTPRRLPSAELLPVKGRAA